MAKLTPQEFADKWARRTSAATTDYVNGVNRVDKSPTEAAASKQTKMVNNLTAAVQSGKWASRLRAVSLDQWKTAAVQKGQARIATGVQAAQADMATFADQLLTYETSLQSKVAAMPDLTLADSVNRVTTWITEMAKFQRR